MVPLKQNNKNRTIKIDVITAKRPKFHFKIDLKSANLAGVALETAKPGDKVRVARQGFYSDFDGDFFFTCINEISGLILGDWLNKNKIKESQISNCLIFIDKKSQAEVYVNCPTFMEVTVKESSKNQNVVMREDISDILKVSFSGVNLRSDLTIIYIFSNRWRRGIYFNFLPLDPDTPSSEPTNLNVLFGACHAYLAFPEIYQYQKLPELKGKLYGSGWFPFIRILGKPFTEIFNTIKNGMPLSDIETFIVASFDEKTINSMYNSWLSNHLFKQRESFLKKGIEEYLEKDYISAIHVLYPCIEGILQDLSYDVDSQGDSGERLTTKLILYLKSKNPETQLLLPENFKEYLIDSYFMKFNRKSEEIDLSRHSLAHGAATNEEDYTQVKTLQAILILDQLSSYVEY
jgi:hypothetical protein